MTETNPVYVASPIKKRRRATKAELGQRTEALLAIVERIRPCTVRQAFYACVVRGVVEKSEAAYAKIQRLLVQLRRDGELDWDAIADNTRWQRKPCSFSRLEDAVANAAQAYRRDLWHDADAYVEIWIEKDALAGVLIDVTSQWDVPLLVSRGYSSVTYLYTSAQALAARDKPAFVYHFGDFDPSGQDAARCIEAGLREHAPATEIHFERVAVTPQQIGEWDLPTRPTKASDPRAKKWTGGGSVELDAIDPRQLRDLCEGVILRHVDRDRLKVIQTAEENEKQFLAQWSKIIRPEARP